jgi:hypothetical protein
MRRRGWIGILLMGSSISFAAGPGGPNEYELQMLRGARTAYFDFSQFNNGECVIDQDISREGKRLLQNIGRLGLMSIELEDIEAGRILPDLTVLVVSEASVVNSSIAASACSIYVKLEAIHSMVGRTRYGPDSIVLRILAYRTVKFGTAPQEKTYGELSRIVVESLSGFADAYHNANR